MTKNTSKTYEEHPFAEYVRILGKGKKGSRSLTEEEATSAMAMILNNEVEDLQLGAFLMLLRVKEESPEELSGFVKAAKANMSPPEHLKVDLDWSSYAGKRRHLPWYLFSVICLAQNGMKIFMHGASGHTADRIYTEDTLRDLGLPVSLNWQEAEESLNSNNFCYTPLSSLSPRLADMINMRPILGLRSPVHSLSRLINPLNAETVLQGIFHPAYSSMHQKAGMLLNYKRVAVIKGEGGEIERNPDNDLNVLSSTSGELNEENWPKMFDRRHVKPNSMSINHMRAVWNGEATDEYAEGAIIGTIAIALKTTNKSKNQEDAIATAKEYWNSRDKNYLNKTLP